ncbi:PhzF family phenazine biosynthesis protein [Lacimicrobium sp. SS2-24]|uniref:PhzF family phenazine biosynthesis protein n=1 Tax=Lacimicrobium sp. SS2-24 TaxID=2005569 RepID=UPI000B4B099F|nr:PhzF family phenazine biosynthesis protein [Lacimicrobium sp. SS2-24]
MHISLYQVDAFASQPFEGNPAAVCPLPHWPDDSLLQRIAEENNLSETAFFVPMDDHYQLRWFTPAEEVDLCGHATLAAAHVLFKHGSHTEDDIVFETRSGRLTVRRNEEGLVMDFPASMPRVVSPPAALLDGLGCTPCEVLQAFDYIVVLASEQQVKTLTPDLSLWLKLDGRGVVVTAPGDKVDFVSRCFFPKLRINEDPVTGSAHCETAPLWASKLDKTTLIATQLSSRCGKLKCEVKGDRVELTGRCADYLQGTITL